jgi:hypothetical protein
MMLETKGVRRFLPLCRELFLLHRRYVAARTDRTFRGRWLERPFIRSIRPVQRHRSNHASNKKEVHRALENCCVPVIRWGGVFVGKRCGRHAGP